MKRQYTAVSLVEPTGVNFLYDVGATNTSPDKALIPI